MHVSPYHLRCEHLSKSYQDGSRTVVVLKNINLNIPLGRRVAIIGASGSGKSTLLHLLGGLDQPSLGEVYLGDYKLAQLPEPMLSQVRNQHLGFVYQFHHLLPEFNLLENVCMPLLIRHTPLKMARERAHQVLEQVGLKHRAHHYPHEISGGERQRTAIARALVTQPSYLLADEPTGNLDEETAQQVFTLMLNLNKLYNIAIIMVTHDLGLAAQFDEVWRLSDNHLHRHI